MVMVVLGLGSNLGVREEYLRQAVKHIGAMLQKVRCSPVYVSAALLPEHAPKDWDLSFLNMAVCGETTLAPAALLSALKEIEQMVGRRPRDFWGPREIDIDILAYGNETIAESGLVIPHQELLHRDFALVPLADLVPDWIPPSLPGKTAQELATTMRGNLKKTATLIL